MWAHSSSIRNRFLNISVTTAWLLVPFPSESEAFHPNVKNYRMVTLSMILSVVRNMMKWSCLTTTVKMQVYLPSMSS
ncbi:hypothetical protein P9112_003469 [Eukaryota sp. TZLM1-RC]